MRNELLNHLQLDDLKGEAHELAETIGMDAFRRLVDVYGGTGRVYIPQADTLLIPIRDRLIREEYNGYNVYELCKNGTWAKVWSARSFGTRFVNCGRLP